MSCSGWLIAYGSWRMASVKTAGEREKIDAGKARYPGWINSKSALLAVLGLTVIFAGAMPLALVQIRSLPAPVFWLMALIAGCMGGMVYPLAISMLQTGREPRRPPAEETRRSAAAGKLYGADLLGGCMGALIGAAFLVPVLGIPQTCALVAVAALAGAVAMM